MKFDIIVKDVSLEELPSLVSKLTGATSTENTTVYATQPNVSTQSNNVEEDDSSVDVSGQTDSEGLPWDARIHSSSKGKTTNGVWKAKRGRTEEEYTAVKSQLLLGLQMSAPTAPVSMTPPVINQYASVPVQQAVAIAPPVLAAVPLAPVQQYAPPEIPAPVQLAQPVFNPVQEANTFQSVINRMNAGFQRGSMTPEHVTSLMTQLNQSFGTNVNNVTEIANSQPMIDKAVGILASMGL